MRDDERPPLIADRGTDEYRPPRPRGIAREAVARWRTAAEDAARSVGVAPGAYAASRLGTAATLRAIDAAAGGDYYGVPAEAERDREAADAALGGDELVVDVQTHYVGSGRARLAGADGVFEFLRAAAPERFAGLDRETGLSFAEYLRCVYLESDTAVAVLTAAPGEPAVNILPNDGIAGTRALLEQLGATHRMLHHAIVHPNEPGESERVAETVERFRPAGLKVYTLYGRGADPTGGPGWRLDDERVGLPFLERARAAGVRVVCAHKGLSGLAPTGSPADVGPAARAFPDLEFLVYHSGYELAPRAEDEERAYADAVRHRGTNRLVASLRDAGVAPGANVWAELGSTWYQLIRRPEEAAHVLGKLLLAVGEDRVLWGTDSVWYGPAGPLVDAFRAFRIPERLREAHGYPELTPERKAKILGGNAARVYGIDADAARRASAADDLGWIRYALRAER